MLLPITSGFSTSKSWTRDSPDKNWKNGQKTLLKLNSISTRIYCKRRRKFAFKKIKIKLSLTFKRQSKGSWHTTLSRFPWSSNNSSKIHFSTKENNNSTHSKGFHQKTTSLVLINFQSYKQISLEVKNSNFDRLHTKYFI